MGAGAKKLPACYGREWGYGKAAALPVKFVAYVEARESLRRSPSPQPLQRTFGCLACGKGADLRIKRAHTVRNVGEPVAAVASSARHGRHRASNSEAVASANDSQVFSFHIESDDFPAAGALLRRRVPGRAPGFGAHEGKWFSCGRSHVIEDEAGGAPRVCDAAHQSVKRQTARLLEPR